MACTDPVGVFDSGLGGISVLRALRNWMPGEDFLYYGDSRHAPYGDRPAPGGAGPERRRGGVAPGPRRQGHRHRLQHRHLSCRGVPAGDVSRPPDHRHRAGPQTGGGAPPRGPRPGDGHGDDPPRAEVPPADGAVHGPGRGGPGSLPRPDGVCGAGRLLRPPAEGLPQGPFAAPSHRAGGCRGAGLHPLPPSSGAPSGRSSAPARRFSTAPAASPARLSGGSRPRTSVIPGPAAAASPCAIPWTIRRCGSGWSCCCAARSEAAR